VKKNTQQYDMSVTGMRRRPTRQCEYSVPQTREKTAVAEKNAKAG